MRGFNCGAVQNQSGLWLSEKSKFGVLREKPRIRVEIGIHAYIQRLPYSINIWTSWHRRSYHSKRLSEIPLWNSGKKGRCEGVGNGIPHSAEIIYLIAEHWCRNSWDIRDIPAEKRFPNDCQNVELDRFISRENGQGKSKLTGFIQLNLQRNHSDKDASRAKKNLMPRRKSGNS